MQCWCCNKDNITLLRKGISPETLSAGNFAITDSSYGSTLDIYKCNSCGFLFCPSVEDVTSFYAEMKDEAYEEGREVRALQAKKILGSISKYRSSGKLLDIGCGSGILVEQALAMGFDASGVEPGRWLSDQAIKHGLPVTCGTFPAALGLETYDIITIIDVIEHITDPAQVMKDIHARLSDGGIAVIITPDVNSIAAKLLGSKWWHFRIAHIGYFNRKTLGMITTAAGLKIIKWKRPGWYFHADYLVIRLAEYLPFIKPLARIPFLKKITVPLNLGDSLMLIAKK